MEKDLLAKAASDPDAAIALHRENAAKLLEISINYCQEFVPGQIELLEKHIATINTRIEKCGNPRDLQSLATALTTLVKGHSALLEQSTIVYMASSKPLLNILSSDHFTLPVPPPPPAESSIAEKPEDNDDEEEEFDPSKYHKPYTED